MLWILCCVVGTRVSFCKGLAFNNMEMSLYNLCHKTDKFSNNKGNFEHIFLFSLPPYAYKPQLNHHVECHQTEDV